MTTLSLYPAYKPSGTVNASELWSFLATSFRASACSLVDCGLGVRRGRHPSTGFGSIVHVRGYVGAHD